MGDIGAMCGVTLAVGLLMHRFHPSHPKQRIFQPRGFATQALKQVSRSNSQFWPIITGGTTGETCWVPAVGGGAGGGVRSLVHVSNRTWHFVEHEVCAILFFGMGVKLPAKLAGVDAKRIIAT